jgi:histone H3/H4
LEEIGGFIMAKKSESKEAPKKASAPKKAVERKSFISKAPVRRLMKVEGADLVSEDALVLMISKLEEIATATTKKAMSLVKDEKRKRLTGPDISMAAKL